MNERPANERPASVMGAITKALQRPTCKSCSHWKPVEAADFHYFGMKDATGGTCENPKIMENQYAFAPDTLVYSYDEGGCFWTGSEFGCVHHSPQGHPDRIEVPAK